MLAVADPPADAAGLVQWAALLAYTRPRAAARLYQAARAAGEPATARGEGFLVQCLLKDNDLDAGLGAPRRGPGCIIVS